jgi:putative endonuclease
MYVGQTNDLAGRLRQHNAPGTNRSLYTKRGVGPWDIAHAEEFASRKEAMARERFLKSGQGREWLKSKLKTDGPR